MLGVWKLWIEGWPLCNFSFTLGDMYTTLITIKNVISVLVIKALEKLFKPND